MKILMGALGVLLFSGAVWAGDFTDNQNGTVTDNTTGLIWQQQDDGAGRTWEAAISYCEGLSLAGYTDWRLPNVNELESITDDNRVNPSIDPAVFPDTQSYYYWSSTTHVGSTNGAWLVDFNVGFVSYYGKGYGFFVRCARGGQ